MSVDQFLAAAGLVIAAVAFGIGLLQYRKAQRWKRAEWVAAEVRRFLDTPSIGQALAMIDWGTRRLLLLPCHPDPDKRYVIVTDDLVSRALMPHKDHQREHGNFTDAEAAIRDCFDCLLDGLDRFETFIKAELITSKDVEPYLDYWIARISLRHPSTRGQQRFEQLAEYIRAYEFAGVTNLLARFDGENAA